MIKKYLLRTIAALALAFVIAISASPHAQAAAPNSLFVLTAFQPYGGTAEPFNAGGTAVVLGKAASAATNNRIIPIGPWPQSGTQASEDQQNKYKGNHLDTNNNGSTDANSISWATSGTPNNFGGYSYQLWQDLIWCGEAGGLPEGALNVDVTVGGYDTVISVGNVLKYGRWSGQWWRQDAGVIQGGTNNFDGRFIRITAINPGTIVVKYTFIEDPPSGTLSTTKLEVNYGGSTVASPAAAVANSVVKYYSTPSGATSPTFKFFPSSYEGTLAQQTAASTANPVVRNNVGIAYNKFKAEVDVPAGYRLLRATTSNPSNSNATTKCAANVAKTGTCSVTDLQVVEGVTTIVEFYIQKIPVSDGALTCITEAGKNYFTGWGINKDDQGNSPTIGIYEGSTLKQTVSGNVLNPSITAWLNALGYATNETTMYNIKAELDPTFHDGAEHTVTPKINGQELPNGPSFTLNDPASSGCRVVDKWLWPWLQTTQGNVVANGKITGHSASDTNPGARATATNPPAKEVDFLIISKVGGGGPFCSNKNYILTNASATGGTNCGNGSGYSVNVASVAAGTEPDDKVVAGVKAAYNDLPTGCRSETSTLPTSTIVEREGATACPNGIIVKYTGTSLASYELKKGRVTILVEGNLTIDQNVGYGTAGYSDPRDVPNLAIVVEGNVTVLPLVSRVDASIYATGFISTCKTASDDPIVFCGYQLTINGFLSAQSGFIFGRAYINNPIASEPVPLHDPAEKINLTLQSVVYPPPGIHYSSVFKGDSSVKIDSSEYQPRF